MPLARTRLLERLAALLTPGDGAEPAYGEAAGELERYLEEAPGEMRRPELAALRALLARRVAEPAGPDSRSVELEEQVRELRDRVERLGRENRELREVVERLKELDADMEQKRRRVR